MKFFTCAGVIALMAFPGLASAAVYECSVTKSNSSYIPEIVIIDYNASSGEVTVIDPVIKHFVGGAISGEVATENNKRITFKWSIDGTKADAQKHVNWHYRATYLKGSSKLVITGKPLGYTNNFRGNGACKIN